MAIINFPFEKKEGKYFSPIVSEKTTYKVENGVVVTDSTTLVNGVKGVYNKVRLTLFFGFITKFCIHDASGA